MIIVHHLENSRSQRVLWLAEELGLEYAVKRYERNPKTMLAPLELEQIHPLGKSPVIVDSDADGDTTVAETGAIIEYMVAKAGGKLAPAPASKEHLRYVYWLHYAEGTLMPLLVMKLIFGRLNKAPMPLPLRPFGGIIAMGVQQKFLDPRLANNLGFINDELAKNEWFAGSDFSAADIMMSFPLEAAVARGGLDMYPNIGKFVQRIHAMPGYKKALERGGPYELLM